MLASDLSSISSLSIVTANSAWFMISQPTDVLPRELLSTVFLWGLPDSRYRSGMNRYRRSISQVCRSWRALCLGTPLFWRAIYVGVPSYRYPLRMESLIRRAGKVPLDLDIEIDNDDGAESGVKNLLRRLRAEIPRLRTLRFRSDWVEHVVEFFPLGPSMPFLKSLEINLEHTPSNDLASLNLWDHDSSFPALESISINGGIPPDAFRCIPCHQILYLKTDIDGLNTLGVEERIVTLTRLQSLSLDLYDSEDAKRFLDGAKKYLPQLPRNSLHFMQFTGSIDMLPRSIGDTSSIRHLDLQATWDIPMPFEKTHFPRLSTFSLPLISRPDHHVLCEFLCAHPSIFAIELEEYNFYSNFRLLFSTSPKSENEDRKVHSVRFVRIIGARTYNALHQGFENDLQHSLRSPWAPRIEWTYRDNPDTGQRWPDYHPEIKAVVERFPGQFRWIDEHEAIPFHEISSLGTDGWPIRE